MATHRIDLRPDLRKQKWGDTPMLYCDKQIGASDQPEYAAARWLLDNNAAAPTDKLETYRGEMFCMSGIVGELAKLTIEESRHGNPTFSLRRWRPHGMAVLASRTAEDGDSEQ